MANRLERDLGESPKFTFSCTFCEVWKGGVQRRFLVKRMNCNHILPSFYACSASFVPMKIISWRHEDNILVPTNFYPFCDAEIHAARLTDESFKSISRIICCYVNALNGRSFNLLFSQNFIWKGARYSSKFRNFAVILTTLLKQTRKMKSKVLFLILFLLCMVGTIAKADNLPQQFLWTT